MRDATLADKTSLCLSCQLIRVKFLSKCKPTEALSTVVLARADLCRAFVRVCMRASRTDHAQPTMTLNLSFKLISQKNPHTGDVVG